MTANAQEHRDPPSPRRAVVADQDDPRVATIAVACNAEGRSFFASLNGRYFAQVNHFPCSFDEARALVESDTGSLHTREQLVALHGTALAMVPLRGA